MTTLSTVPKPLTRRRALQAPVAALAAGALPAAWAQGTPPASAPAPLQIVGPWEISGLAPARSGYVFTRLQVTETLLDAADDGQPRPALARLWRRSADGLVWQFELRPGARFHDGTPVTAAAVVRSLQAAQMAPALLSQAPIESISAPDVGTVLIRLQRPHTALPALLAHSSTMVLAPASYGADGKVRSIIGSGPYRIAQLVPPQQVETVVFDAYDGLRPAIAAVRYLAASRAETRALMAESGQADLAYGLDPASLRRLQRHAQNPALARRTPGRVAHPAPAPAAARPGSRCTPAARRRLAAPQRRPARCKRPAAAPGDPHLCGPARAAADCHRLAGAVAAGGHGGESEHRQLGRRAPGPPRRQPATGAGCAQLRQRARPHRHAGGRLCRPGRRLGRHGLAQRHRGAGPARADAHPDAARAHARAAAIHHAHPASRAARDPRGVVPPACGRGAPAGGRHAGPAGAFLPPDRHGVDQPMNPLISTPWAALLGRRLVQVLAVSLLIGTLCFLMVRALPGDLAMRVAAGRYGYDLVSNAAADAVRAELGLDRPGWLALLHWWRDMATFNLGQSLVSQRSVWHEVTHHLGATLRLSAAALAIAFAVGVPLGVWAGLRPKGWVDKASWLMAVVLRALPPFLLSVLLILLVAVQWGFLPAGGDESQASLVLPALTLGLGLAAGLARVTRAAMLEVVVSPFFEFARTKGLSDWQALVRHGLRNAAVPVTAYLGVEALFAWPGIGHALVHAVFGRDIPVVQGTALCMGVLFVVFNLLVDAACLTLDPRHARKVAA